MMDYEILNRFESKRNQVYLIKLCGSSDGRLAVMKKYKRDEQSLLEIEYENMQRLRKQGILIPEILYKNSDSIIMEYIQGELAASLTERLDTGEWIDRLALWMTKLHSIKKGKESFLKKDVNLRNFIYSSGQIYGLDFENTDYGDMRSDLGNLCFFILTNTPSFIREKHIMIRRLLHSYEKYSGIELKEMGKILLESRAEAKIRRGHNG